MRRRGRGAQTSERRAALCHHCVAVVVVEIKSACCFWQDYVFLKYFWPAERICTTLLYSWHTAHAPSALIPDRLITTSLSSVISCHRLKRTQHWNSTAQPQTLHWQQTSHWCFLWWPSTKNLPRYCFFLWFALKWVALLYFWFGLVFIWHFLILWLLTDGGSLTQTLPSWGGVNKCLWRWSRWFCQHSNAETGHENDLEDLKSLAELSCVPLECWEWLVFWYARNTHRK